MKYDFYWRITVFLNLLCIDIEVYLDKMSLAISTAHIVK